MIVKKILFLSAWYPTHYDSMPGLFVKRHAEILTDFFDVAVLHTLAIDEKPKGYEIEKLIEDKILTIRVYYPKVKTQFPVICQFLKLWRFFKAYLIGLKEIRKHFGLPDLVHANILTRVGLIAIYLKLIYRIPYVITEHWTRYTSERKAFKGVVRKALTKLIVSKSSGISAVSENLKIAMVNYGISNPNFFIVHNIVDCEFFKPNNEPQQNPKKIFSHISCFDDKAKNVTGIIRVIADLSKQRSDFVCLMIGDGPDWPKAIKLADDLGINDKTIKFTGLLEGNELVDVYNQSLFTVLFSNYENMPVVISESFACGKPVVATSVGGIPEIVNESTGILVPPRNEEKLTTAIVYMLDHHREFDAAQIRNYAIDQFGKESVRKQLLQLYHSVLGNMEQ